MDRRKFLGTSMALSAISAFGVKSLSANGTGKVFRQENIIVDGCSPTFPTQEWIELLKKGGVNCWHSSSVGSLLYLSNLLTFLDKHKDEIELAKSTLDIYRIAEEGKIATTFGWQSADPLVDTSANNWAVKPPQTSLRAYYELGLRVLNLVYNVTNKFAGGCLNPEIGLSRAGRYLVAEAQEMGMLVDCGGHTGEKSSLDIIKIAKKPVVCTHSNVDTLNKNPRNTSDRVIKGIANSGGLFAISAIDPFMRWGPHTMGRDPDSYPKSNVARIVDEFDYLRKLVGVDHIGLGADFTHGANARVDGSVAFAFSEEMTYAHQPIAYADGFEDPSQTPNLIVEMENRSWRQEDIGKVMGGNWLRVYKDAWGS